MSSDTIKLRNPEKDASGNQLYHLNRLGLLAELVRDGQPITMAEASEALSKAKAEGRW